LFPFGIVTRVLDKKAATANKKKKPATENRKEQEGKSSRRGQPAADASAKAPRRIFIFAHDKKKKK
jgi:hypothetical protein